MKKSKLLPHNWQLAGFGLFAVLAIWILISLIKQKGLIPPTEFEGYRIQYYLWKVAVAISCCIMAFSQEKVEDEWISSIRYRSLLTSLIIGLSISIVISIVNGCIGIYGGVQSRTAFNYYLHMLLGFYSFPLLYMIVLKVSLLIQKRKLSKSDGAGVYALQMKQPFMLPHKWQNLGFAVGIACYACLVIGSIMLAEGGSLIHLSGLLMAVGKLISPVALTASALSKEKIEDERIKDIRRTALSRTTVIYLAVLIISIFASSIISRMTTPEVMAWYHVISGVFFGWSPFMIYYFVIYKISLWNENKALDNEE